MRTILLLSVAALVGCSGDIPPECRSTCDECCAQANECSSVDVDECYSTCFDNCQRAYAIYRNSACFDARITLKHCVCALECEALAEWEAGTGDHCTTETAAEETDCDWF